MTPPAAAGTDPEVDAALDPEAGTRPRVEGERELEILRATLGVLAEVGYDRLTMDAVAAAAKASKATLYRRWRTKSALVIDAVLAQKEPLVDVDTGSLRGDLLATFCGVGGLTDDHQLAVLSSVVTAIVRDPTFAAAFRRDVLAPKHAHALRVFERARERGEIDADLDLDVLATALAGTVLHRTFVMGHQPTVALVTEVVDQVILPAARRRADPAPPPVPTSLTPQTARPS